MKLFLKIFAGFMAALILFVIALNLYFTDDRLKQLIQPRLSESLQTEVGIGHISLTFFRTFPNIGIDIEGFQISADGEQPALSIERLTGGLRLTPLFRKEIDITQLIMDNPTAFYQVYSDSTTNYDWFFNREPAPDDTTSSMRMNIPEFLINNAEFRYVNDISGGFYELTGLSADISIDYGETLESTIDATLLSMRIASGSVRDTGSPEPVVADSISPGFPMELHQVTSYDPDSKILTLTEGVLTVQELELELAGEIDNSGPAPHLNLSFSTAADDVAQLIHLLPETYRERLGDTDASGSLTVEGSLRGEFSDERTPQLELIMAVADGSLRNSAIRAPLENIRMTMTATNERLELQELSFSLAGKNLQANGYLDDPFTDSAVYRFSLTGNGNLNDMTEWVPLDPWIRTVSGDATMDLSASGPLDDLYAAALNGRLALSNVAARGDSLVLPVSDLNAVLTLSPTDLSLENLSMRYGSSDIRINGSLSDYLSLPGRPTGRTRIPELTGEFHSRLFNLDELIDWEDDTETRYNIDLPDLNSRVNARIDTLLMFGVPVTALSGRSETTPGSITFDNTVATLFGGRASGSLVWDVSDPASTHLSFEGRLDSLQIEGLFTEFPVLGHGSRLQEHVKGLIHADVTYETGLNSFLDPELPTIRSEGRFGLTEASISGHPIQLQLAKWLQADEFRNLELDDWQAEFSVSGSQLTFSNLQLSSANIGLDLSGTQELESGTINFTATLMLPGRFRNTLTSVLPERAVTLLTRDDGRIFIPIQISGTMTAPEIAPRQKLIDDLLRQTATDAARRTLNRLFQREGLVQ